MGGRDGRGVRKLEFGFVGRWAAIAVMTMLADGLAPAGAVENAREELQVLVPVGRLAEGGAVRVEVATDLLRVATASGTSFSLMFPRPDGEPATLNLERFEVTTSSTRFESRMGEVGVSVAPPHVVLFRGAVRGQPGSRAFLALSDVGIHNGYVVFDDGRRFVLSTSASSLRGSAPVTTIHQDTATGFPDFDEVCGLQHVPNHAGKSVTGAVRSASLLGAPRMAFLAVDGDQTYVQLFGSDAAAQAYIVQLVGAISDIYIRDFDLKLILSRVRTWPGGGEPFSAADLGGLWDYWHNVDDLTGLNIVHLLSGRRDTSYGGVAFLADPCGGDAVSISAFLLGSFPVPTGEPNLGNWDVVVMAHEIGHNLGTGHTHDSYSPPIDECGSLGTSARSDIMSYCHTTQGGLLNTDLRFHRLVQEVVTDSIVSAGCLAFDCNNNSVGDAIDIGSATSVDVNLNNVPDECEDCNANSILDSVDIGGGMGDVNGNGVPDVCEPDCDGDSVPDEFEITADGSLDQNGDLRLDICEPDCDGNGVPDHIEIAAGTKQDIDRDGQPDNCQDCDSNGQVDYIDVDREYHVFVGDLADYVREYHRASGVAIRNLGAGTVQDVNDVVFGPDGGLYVSSFGNDRVIRIDVDAGAVTTFVNAGVGGLDGPSGLAFGPGGDLFVASRLNSRILRFNGVTGALVGTFVAAGSGGLTTPFGLVFGAEGNLYVGCGDNTVRRYDGVTGAFVSTFVTAGSGGLNGPRGLAFTPDGRLLVANFTGGNILEYGATGAFQRNFSAPYNMPSVWGLRLAPNGNVYAGRQSVDRRIIEFDVTTGRYIRSPIRGDSSLISPTGFAFRGPSPRDCNGNFVPDLCDIQEGVLTDADSNSIPDECDCIPQDCADADPCTIDSCQIAFGVGTCNNAPLANVLFGDVDLSGAVELGDLLCELAAYAGIDTCARERTDLVPCGQPNGIVELAEILAVLGAYEGNPPCPNPCGP